MTSTKRKFYINTRFYIYKEKNIFDSYSPRTKWRDTGVNLPEKITIHYKKKQERIKQVDEALILVKKDVRCI